MSKLFLRHGEVKNSKDIFYGDLIGAEKIHATMRALEAGNDSIKPAKTLTKLAEHGGKFIDVDLGGLKTG